MTRPIAAPRFGGRRLELAFALFAFVLLMASCARRAALEKSVRSEMSPYVAAERSGGGGARDYMMTASLVSSNEVENPPARKITRSGSLDLLVSDVGQSVNRVGSIVSGIGGYVEKSTLTNSAGHSANMTVRVPSGKLDQAIAEIKGLATTVDREGVEARDVTGEYVDLDARLRNAQAEETQYLLILKRATTIKDTLDVTEKLSDVRGRIEQMQGEMKLLTSQIEMSSLEISLRAEAEAAVAGIRWRPLRQAKIAASEMVSGLADWADSVISFFINLPLIGVWLVSVVILILVAVRILRFLWQRFGPKTSWRMPWRRSTPRDETSAH